MGALIALGFVAFLGAIFIGIPIVVIREVVRMESSDACQHLNAAGRFCPDCGGRVRAPSRATKHKEVKPPPPDTKPKQEQTQSDTTRPSAVTEAVLTDLALGLKDLGFDKPTAKQIVERLRPMAEQGASLNDLINEALKR